MNGVLLLIFVVVEPIIHPTVVLKDQSQHPVVQSGRPIDLRASCGGDCHDVGYIESNSYHVRTAADVRPADLAATWPARFLPLVHNDPRPAAGPFAELRWVGGTVARPMNCLLCHVAKPNFKARAEALVGGAPEWEATATLTGSPLVQKTVEGWRYAVDVFDAEGGVSAGALGLGAPRSEACLTCHGQLARSVGTTVGNTVAIAPAVPLSRGWATGLVYSGRSMHKSALNLTQKASLDRPFDVHAERLLACTSCHPSTNNPAFRTESRDTRPPHLAFDPRRETPAQFVRRPSHDFATGQATQSVLREDRQGTMRRCENCHQAEATHDWLPYKRRHFGALACETCHISRVYAPLLETVDWTVMTSTATPRTIFRGTHLSPDDPRVLQEGFQPVWLARPVQGRDKVVPYNLVTYLYWVSGAPERPVSVADLRKLYFEATGELKSTWHNLDVDGDGRPDGLSTVSDVKAVSAALGRAGFADARIVAEVKPFGLHHGVATKSHAQRRCDGCHNESAAPASAVSLVRTLPPGVIVTAPDIVTGAGSIERASDGEVWFVPNLDGVGVYVLGLSSVVWIDAAGLAMILLVLVGALSHGAGRLISARRRTT